MVRKWRRLLVGHVFRRAAMYRTRVAFSSWRSCTSEIGIGGMLVPRHRVMFQAVHTLAKWSQQSFSRAFSKWRALTTQWRRQNADVAERHVTNLRERIFRDVAKKKALSAPRYAFYRWRLHCFESAHSLVAIGLMAPTMRAFLGWRGAAALGAALDGGARALAQAEVAARRAGRPASASRRSVPGRLWEERPARGPRRSTVRRSQERRERTVGRQSCRRVAAATRRRRCRRSGRTRARVGQRRR